MFKSELKVLANELLMRETKQKEQEGRKKLYWLFKHAIEFIGFVDIFEAEVEGVMVPVVQWAFPRMDVLTQKEATLDE